MIHKRALCLGLIAGILTFVFLSSYQLSHYAKADQRDRWEGTVDQKLESGEQRDKAIFKMMEDVRLDIKNMCNDITEIKVKAAQSGALYGGGSGLAVYLITLLGGFLKKKNGK